MGCCITCNGNFCIQGLTVISSNLHRIGACLKFSRICYFLSVYFYGYSCQFSRSNSKGNRIFYIRQKRCFTLTETIDTASSTDFIIEIFCFHILDRFRCTCPIFIRTSRYIFHLGKEIIFKSCQSFIGTVFFSCDCTKTFIRKCCSILRQINFAAKIAVADCIITAVL